MTNRLIMIAALATALSMPGLARAQNTNSNTTNSNSNRSSNSNSNSNSNRMWNSNSSNSNRSTDGNHSGNSNRMWNNNSSNSDRSTNSNSSGNSKRSHDDNSKRMSNSNSDMSGAGMSGSARGRMGGTAGMMDMKFAMEAAHINNAQIASGQMAISKSTNPDVTSFAQMMINEHMSANADLARAYPGMMLPAGLDPMHRALADGMEKLSGTDFDMAYVISQKAGHAMALDMLDMYDDGGKNKELKSYAKRTESAVKRHYGMIKALDMKMSSSMPMTNQR